MQLLLSILLIGSLLFFGITILRLLLFNTEEPDVTDQHHTKTSGKKRRKGHKTKTVHTGKRVNIRMLLVVFIGIVANFFIVLAEPVTDARAFDWLLYYASIPIFVLAMIFGRHFGEMTGILDEGTAGFSL